MSNGTSTEHLSSTDTNVETLWILQNGFLVFFMQCGFAMLEAGTVRKQNIINILLKNLVDSCVAALIWWAFGYPFAFGDGDSLRRFIGGSKFFLGHVDVDNDDDQVYAEWFFQWAFAATAATIVSGALAERCQFRAYVVYTIVVTGLVYPIVVHWVWSDDGWLSTERSERTFSGSVGFIDHAGSSVVHITGGGAALFAAWKVGPRLDRFKQGFIREPQNPGFCLLGTFILWFGWYAFNSASGLCADKDCMITASLVAVNTTISAATGGTTVLILHFLVGGIIELAPGLNGILAGLVSITAGCAVVEPYAAFIIGSLGSSAYYGSRWVLEKIQIDDPLDASPVHFVAGIVGTIAVGFFAKFEHVKRRYENDNTNSSSNHNITRDDVDVGVFYGGNGTQLGVQILGTLVIAAWTCTINYILFSVLKHYDWLKVRSSKERQGLDATMHRQTPTRTEGTENQESGVTGSEVAMMNR
eukprot:g3949.t1